MATVLAVSAHPDDETLFAGGTLARYASLGHEVYILETTRGEGGEVGEPPLTSQESLGSYREQEARRAARTLGMRDIIFLPFIDPYMEINGIPRRIDVALADFVRAIAERVDLIQPQVVVTRGSNGEYGHPQHIYTHRATRQPMETGHPQIVLMSWSAWYESPPHARILNRHDPADMVVDITPWIDKKINAALCHETQHAMFLRNSGAPTVADMVWKTESFHIWTGQLPPELEL